jgi:hypothetical protein
MNAATSHVQVQSQKSHHETWAHTRQNAGARDQIRSCQVLRDQIAAGNLPHFLDMRPGTVNTPLWGAYE